MLQTTNPIKTKKCNRNYCPVCTIGGKEDCRAKNVTDQLTGWDWGDLFIETTTRSAYARRNEHIRDLILSHTCRTRKTQLHSTKTDFISPNLVKPKMELIPGDELHISDKNSTS